MSIEPKQMDADNLRRVHRLAHDSHIQYRDDVLGLIAHIAWQRLQLDQLTRERDDARAELTRRQAASVLDDLEVTAMADLATAKIGELREALAKSEEKAERWERNTYQQRDARHEVEERLAKSEARCVALADMHQQLSLDYVASEGKLIAACDIAKRHLARVEELEQALRDCNGTLRSYVRDCEGHECYAADWALVQRIDALLGGEAKKSGQRVYCTCVDSDICGHPSFIEGGESE